MAKLRKYIVTNGFKDFLPSPTDFKIVEEPITALEGGEFLVKAEYISVDPYMRSFADSCQTPYEQFGFQVGRVIDSKHEEFPIGTNVVSHSGWRDYVVLKKVPDDMFQIRPYETKSDDLPLSLAIGALGMSGMTAYLGLLEVCKPKKGEVLCVTSAAGAVGSIVGQLARLRGCTVIGFAGSDDKIKMIAEHLGFHYAFNYKSVSNIEEVIKSIAPEGLDCYFDNVGGDLADKIMNCMKKNGKVIKCGSLSIYGKENDEDKPRVPSSVKVKPITFLQWSWLQQQEAISQLTELIRKGDVKAKETVITGFENLPDALVAMLSGENVGKTVVKI